MSIVIIKEIERLISKGFTEYAVAAMCGITQSALNKFRNGADIRLSTASKICDGLKLRLVKK